MGWAADYADYADYADCADCADYADYADYAETAMACARVFRVLPAQSRRNEFVDRPFEQTCRYLQLENALARMLGRRALPALRD